MSANRAIEKVRVEGIWTGVIEVELVTWTTNMLRAEVARQLDCAAESIRLMSSDINLFDSVLSLSQLGIKNNERILSNRSGFGQNGEQHVFFEEMWCTFVKLSEVLENTENNEQEEDQSENKFKLGSWDDQKAALLGLTIHSEAKVLINRRMYKGALQLLDLAERTFSLCNQENLEMFDNMALLNIETVWCHFMLRDIPALSVEGDRLMKARESLEVALERDFSRITRFLRGVPLIETALTMRLELLEGVVAYHTGRLEDARKALESANEKCSQLEVPEKSSLSIQSKGYKEEDANMALRINENEVSKALEFLEAKQQLDCSPSAAKKVNAVPLDKLKDLVSIGFDMFLAVEALMNNNDDEVKAFNDLANPRTNALLKEQLEGSNKRRRLFANTPGETRFMVETGPYEASDSSSESESDDYMYDDFDDDSDDNSYDDNDDEEEPENMVQSLVNEESYWSSENKSSDDDIDDDSDVFIDDEEEEPENLVRDLANATEPPDYDIEYYYVGVGIEEYLDLVAQEGSKLEMEFSEDMEKLDG